MRITVIVATYGSDEWRKRGVRAYLSVPRGADDIICFHSETKSLAQARNAAAEDATPGWLCFLDADDRLDPDFCTAMKDAVSAGGVEGAPLLVPAIRYGNAPTAEIPAWLADLSIINCAVIGTLVDRDLFREVGGFRDTLNDGTSLTSLEDWELFMRCVKAGAVMVPVPDAIYMAQPEDPSDPARRNSDQSVYHAIRREHADFPWGDVRRYKVGYPDLASS